MWVVSCLLDSNQIQYFAELDLLVIPKGIAASRVNKAISNGRKPELPV